MIIYYYFYEMLNRHCLHLNSFMTSMTEESDEDTKDTDIYLYDPDIDKGTNNTNKGKTYSEVVGQFVTNSYSSYDNSFDSNSSGSSPEDNLQGDNPYKLIKKRVDKSKVRRKRRAELNVRVKSLFNLDMDLSHSIRAGAIIYTKTKKETLFCLGVDSQSGDLTDFGGGVKKNETIIQGGLREFKEESQGVFNSHLNIDSLSRSIAVHSHNMLIMFIPAKINLDDSLETFTKRIISKRNPEVKEIVWLTTEELIDSISGRGRRMYSRVKRLLNYILPTIESL